jgi:hypothetical protein
MGARIPVPLGVLLPCLAVALAASGAVAVAVAVAVGFAAVSGDQRVPDAADRG